MNKANGGRFFEDFEVGQELVHATPRTLGRSEATLYQALTGSRFPLECNDPLARSMGFNETPLDDLLVFHTVFGKSVPDLSLNAVANLGYAQGLFHGPVYPGRTLSARSTVIGLREASSGQAGIVWAATEGRDEAGHVVVEFVRWVLVRKRDLAGAVPNPVVPMLEPSVPAARLRAGPGLRFTQVDPVETGSACFFEDYAIGERIDHVDGMGVMESEHRLATRLYQNTARVHFNDHAERGGRLGACIVYGGHVLSIARALSFNGLGHALRLLAINGGTHANPCIAGDTVFAWSEVLDKADLADGAGAGALRLRLVATRNRPCHDFPLHGLDGRYLPEVLLDLDYWVLMPKRSASWH